jgi:ParB family chromosome partitioning protein
MKKENLTAEVKNETAPVIEKKYKTTQKPIKLDKLQDFKDHPYKVQNGESMEELKASIREVGILNRILVRPLDDQDEKYEIISGHRRVKAAKELGMKEIPAIVYPEIDRDEATLLMVDSNNQRENVSIMEKGRAYRMKLEAIKHQGTSRQSVGKFEESADEISETESGRTVQRYIRLTYLVPELQEYVENGQMKMLPAVEISYLDEEAQRDIVDRITETEVFPSHAQARKMKALFEEGKLDYDTVAEIMNELKPNQVEKLKIPMDDIRKYVPKDYTPQQITELAVKLFKQNYDRQRSRDDAR